MLFYHGYIEDALSHFEDHDVGQITQAFVLEEIEKAANLVEEETAKIISEKEEDFLKQLKERVSIKEQEKEREWVERVQEIKSNIRNGAKRSAKKRVVVLRASVAVILAIPLVYYLFAGNWEAFHNIVRVFAWIFFITGVAIGSIPALWGKLEDKWFYKITINRIKESGLDKYE
jgi:cation transport ATPase